MQKIAFILILMFGSFSSYAQSILKQYNFSYNVSGDKKILPNQVFDDGINTFLQFSEIIKVPTILIATGRTEQTVKTEINGTYLIVPGITRRITLQQGVLKAYIEYLGSEIAQKDKRFTAKSPKSIHIKSKSIKKTTPNYVLAVTQTMEPTSETTKNTQTQQFQIQPATQQIKPKINLQVATAIVQSVSTMAIVNDQSKKFFEDPTKTIEQIRAKSTVPPIDKQFGKELYPATALDNKAPSAEVATPLAEPTLNPEPPPAPPELTWTGRQGQTLRGVITDWAKTATPSWHVDWTTDLDYPIAMDFDVSAVTFLDAVTRIFAPYQKAQRYFSLTQQPKQRVLIVEEEKF